MAKSTFLFIFLLITGIVCISTAQAATTVTASNSSVNYTENDDMYIDPGLTISSTETYTSAKVQIGDGYVSGQDYLRYSTTGSITGSFSTATGILTLSGSGNAAAYQAAFRNVRYENTNENPNTADRNITFVLGGNTLYFEDTGHYYEYVSYTSDWTAAKANADTKTMEGLQGYLATITSEAENNFLMEKIQADAWIGASDNAVEGEWRWVTGPEGTEDGGNGRQFYQGDGYTGSAIPGEYNKWNGPALSYGGHEPNDSGANEDAGQMYSSNYGTWNDLPHTGTSLSGYLLEYGGMSGDATPQLSTTVTLHVNAVNDAPTTPGAFTNPTTSQIKQGGQSLTVGWGASTDPAEGDAVKYDLWFFNGTWAQIGNLLGTNSMSYTLPEDNTENAMFRVYANDTMDNSSARDVTFTIDSIAPDYSWIEKVLNASTGETITVEINVTDVVGVDWCNITVDGQEYEMNSNSGNYSYNISIPASDSGTLVSSMTYNCSFGDLFGHVNSTENVLLNVSILPIANFSVNQSRGISPLNVNFTDNSSGLVENWLWDFGDGSNSTDQNITHTFTSGNYTVNLTVINANGTSSTLYNIRCADEPEYTRSPSSSEVTSAYGEEQNFTIQSTLYSSFEWFIDGSAANGTGVTLFNNTNDSEQLSYCMINSSQYINQNDFFLGTYNVSVQASNESIGRTDTHYWLWTVTNSSSDGGDIEILVNVTPNITINGSEKYLVFNTTNNNDTDDNGLLCSITGASFNTSNNTDGIEIKVEVLNVSSINQSSIDFSASSIYQYLDISFNNETLVNNDSHSRNIEFRVMNEKDGGTLIVSTVYLRHWANPSWQAYTPELTGNDGIYSYFIVRNVSGFSPYAVTCDYQYSSSSSSGSDGLPYYLKKLLFWSDEEVVEAQSGIEIIEDADSTPVSEEVVDPLSDQDSENLDTSYVSTSDKGNNLLQITGIILLAGLLLFVFWKKRKSEDE
ncbi:LPXTG-motif cell wall-anchored protein [Methanohalophilus levihalophilus]|uniref:PKD domain-containing protein n=1 Tax=Methanohalophilus levihalophilus TaxID=1431282 RepID=UPI001AE4923E|nr:PKD domain-containing protein [Methanohalophilus levihalophilus]MBP2030784.1 LPXTG-motif cell wall-anchored protein [Methanohalophilus levihalophilus]